MCLWQAVFSKLGTDIRLPLRRRFERQLRADCALLEALRVMDYSLLLGIHSRSGGGLASTPQHTDAVRPQPRPPRAAQPGVGQVQECTPTHQPLLLTAGPPHHHCIRCGAASTRSSRQTPACQTLAPSCIGGSGAGA